MLLESACLAYAGLANVALARPKYRAALPNIKLKPFVNRALGWTLILLSVIPPFIAFGGPQGTVTWIGAFSLAALALVLLLSRWPARTLKTATFAGFIAIPLLFV